MTERVNASSLQLQVWRRAVSRDSCTFTDPWQSTRQGSKITLKPHWGHKRDFFNETIEICYKIHKKIFWGFSSRVRAKLCKFARCLIWKIAICQEFTPQDLLFSLIIEPFQLKQPPLCCCVYLFGLYSTDRKVSHRKKNLFLKGERYEAGLIFWQ